MNRIAVIDTFRGVMLLLMTIVHLLNLPFNSIYFLKPYFYGFFGYFTDPEGFIFLSGLVAGIVYGKMVLEGRESEARKRLCQRAWQMYVWQSLLFLGCSLGFLFVADFAGNFRALHQVIAPWINGPGIRFFIDHPIQSFGLGSLFLYLPPFLDLLPMYIFFLLAAPFALRLLKQGKTGWLLGASFSLWALAQWIPPRILETTLQSWLPMVKLGWFDAFAWQLLFFAGLTFGFLKAANRMPSPPRILSLLAPLAALGFFCMRHLAPPFPIAANLYELGPLRILSFGAIACTIWCYREYLVFGPLAFLGRYAFPVFVYHTALVYFLVYFQNEISALPLYPKIALLFSLASTIWIPAAVCEWRKRQRAPVQSLLQ